MTIERQEAQKHPKYWFEDGSMTLRVQNHLFRVHRSLICRHSRVLLEARIDTPDGVYILEHGVLDLEKDQAQQDKRDTDERPREGKKNGNNMLDGRINTVEPVLSKDFEELLRHLYHDELLTPTTPFHRVVSLLRISSSKHLDIPQIHELARAEFQRAFPSEPLLLRPEMNPFLHEGLQVATQFGFSAVRKAILYAIVTTHHFNEEEEQGGVSPLPQAHNARPDVHPELEVTTQAGTLSPRDLTLLRTLLSQLISHFTPILYTPSTSSSHMECTEAFADHWMPLVIQPSLVDSDSEEGEAHDVEDVNLNGTVNSVNGSSSTDLEQPTRTKTILSVYRPLESLETIKSINWVEKGLCPECVKEKREEWSDEQRIVWERFGEWVDEASSRSL